MKLLIMLLTVSFVHCYANSTAQTVTISGEDLTIHQIFKAIKQQTGYRLMTNSDIGNHSKTISLSVKDMPVRTLLDLVLKDQPFRYVIEGKTIFLSAKAPNPSKALINPSLPPPEPDPVSGQVLNDNRQPFSGVSIRVLKSNTGIATDANGRFELEQLDEGSEIEISAVGYSSLRLKLQKGTFMALSSNTSNPSGSQLLNASPRSLLIVLKLSISQLDETVVKGYYNTTRRFNTGTVYTIKSEELTKQPVSNPIMALQGRVPNLVITPTSGLPNAAVKFQLRGQNSLSGQSLRSEPLIIIDGVPYQNTLQVGIYGSLFINDDRISALSLVNMNEIEQIDVLSDADATSIYGSRGGNGVILITTKRGKPGAMSVNLSLSTGFSQVSKKLHLLNTQQYLQMRRAAYQNDGIAVPDHSSPIKNITNYDLTVWDSTRYTDWQEVFLGGTSATHTANVSVQGGTSSVQYLISGSYTTQKIIYPGKNKNQLGTTNLNITGSSPDKRFRAQINNSYTFNNLLTPTADFTRLAVTLAPNAPSLFDHHGNLNWEPDTTSPATVSTWTNPYAQLQRTSESANSSFRQNFDVSYQLYDNLIVRTSIGFAEVRTKSLSMYPIASRDPYVTANTGLAFHSNAKSKTFTVDPQISYNKVFNQVKFEALLGASYQSQQQEMDYVSGEGYTSDAFLRSLSAAPINVVYNNSSQYKYVAGFGRLNFNVLNKYIVNATARRDGSSRFGPNYQFGNFWSLAAGYIFTQEEFFKRWLPFINAGKLRASYGTSGNDGISDYQYIELFKPRDGYSYQGLTPLQSLGAINEDYHWENIKKLEVGLELGIWDNRLSLTTTYWRTRANDQLGSYPLPATAGGSSIVKNQDARIQNSGWDFVMDTKIINSRHLTWNMSANMGIQHNKLLARPEGVYNGYGFSRFVTVGEPFTGFVVAFRSKGVNTANGLYQFENADKNITTDPDNNYADALKITTVPLTMGINNSFSFKGISLSFFLQLTKQMGKNFLFDPAFSAYNPGSFSTQNASEFVIEYGNLPVEYLDSWRNPGDNAAFQKLTSNGIASPARVLIGKIGLSDRAWVDASFIRLRNVSLSYNFPDELIKKFHLNTFSVFIQGQNLLTLTRYKGLDPEVQSASALPLLRTIVGGIQIGL